MIPALEVHHLTKTYRSPFGISSISSTRDFKAVDGLSFTVMQGDIYGFLGPNGAGKSSSIRMLLGLMRPDQGSIRYSGKDFSTNRATCLQGIGAIVEKPDFYKYLSALDNLRIFGSMSSADISSGNLFRVLETVGLSGRGEDPVKNYSHGMKQRLGIAQALLHDPSLIILDEPTTGLDPQGIVDLRQLILRLRESGKTIFMSSHILSEVELIATRMVIISKGKAVAEGTIDSLLDADDLIADFSFEDPAAAISVLEGSMWGKALQEQEGTVLRFKLDRNGTRQLNSWLCNNGVPPNGISARRKLEDYFMKLTR